MAVKNIIFDLGGVVLNLDQDKTLRAFKKLGADLDEINYESRLFLDFEIGKITEEDFLMSLKRHLSEGVTTIEIIDAWNSMLLDLPTERLNQIRSLKNNFRLFLLSNTNAIHIHEVFKQHGKETFTDLFEKVYLSHEIGLRKPGVDIYHFVMNDAELKGSETVFVDDNLSNIKGAEEAGLLTIWAKSPVDTWFESELNKFNHLKL